MSFPLQSWLKRDIYPLDTYSKNKKTKKQKHQNFVLHSNISLFSLTVVSILPRIPQLVSSVQDLKHVNFKSVKSILKLFKATLEVNNAGSRRTPNHISSLRQFFGCHKQRQTHRDGTNNLRCHPRQRLDSTSLRSS